LEQDALLEADYDLELASVGVALSGVPRIVTIALSYSFVGRTSLI